MNQIDFEKDQDKNADSLEKFFNNNHSHTKQFAINYLLLAASL